MDSLHSRRDFLLGLTSLLPAGYLLGADDPKFSTGVDVVNVLATVRNKDNKIVRDLTKDDFHLEEDGQVGWIAGGIFYPMEKPWHCFNNAAGVLKDGTPACLNGAVFRTDDGGLTWQEQPVTKSIGRFMSITFVDEKHGWVAGDAGVLHTIDGGNTWRDDDYRFKRGCENYYELQDIHPTGISFLDQKNGLLMFGSGLVAKSTDGGKTWQPPASMPQRR